jgi:hypothetical protein
VNASQSLDIDLFAKKYAILDVIGGHHSVDWSDLKFYYNPVQKLIEPIAYESFSFRPIREIIGFNKFKPDEAYHDDFHTVLFSDATFYARYIHYLKEFSGQNFMPDFFERNDSAIEVNLQVLNNEFAYKRFEPKNYAQNSRLIRKLLDPKYPIHAFNSAAGNGIKLQIGNVSSLPIVVDGIQYNDQFTTINTKVLAPKLSNGFVKYRDVNLNIADSISDLVLHFHLLGEDSNRTVAVFPYEHIETHSLAKDSNFYKDFVGSLFHQKGDSLIFIPGKHKITANIHFPKEITLVAFSGTRISFMDNARFIIEGELVFKGDDRNPIVLVNPNFVFLSSKKVLFKRVLFEDCKKQDKAMFNYPAAIVLDHSSMEMLSCAIGDAEQNFIYANNSSLTINSSSFSTIKSLVKADFSSIKMNNVTVYQIENNAISLDASSLTSKSLFINECKAKALNIEKGSHLNMQLSTFKQCKKALVIKSGSIVNLVETSFQENELDIEIKSKEGYEDSKLMLKGKDAELKVERDEESEVSVE